MAKKIQTPVYMQSFHCLGGDCIDTCCQHWDINLDRYHYNKMEAILREHPEQAGKFQQHIKLHDSETSSDRNYAYISLSDSGYCPFLKLDGLCDIHAQFGIEPLSDVCAFFPRVISSLHDRLEMTGAMSCPEVVRLCLTSDADAQDFTPCSADLLPRQDHLPISRHVTAEDDSFYMQAFERVRDVLLALAAADDFALETRLYFLANFTYRISGNYHQMAEQKPKLLDEEIKRIQSQHVRQQLEDYFNRFENIEPIAVVVIQAILQLRIQHASNDKLSRLAAMILDDYRKRLSESDNAEIFADNLPPQQLWLAYQSNWETANARVGVLLEKIFSRYLRNVLQREWFIAMPDPFVYMQMLIIRISLLRFLAASHPRIIELLAGDLGDAPLQEAVTDEMVKLIYLFARSIDHNHAFLNVIFQAMLEQQMLSFDYSLPFIKI